MRGFALIRAANQELAQKLNGNGGFLDEDDLKEIIKIDRLMQILVRCNGGRFLCAAQDVEHFVKIIEEHAELVNDMTRSDWVRDISLPA